ncbi:MAG TPA: DUF5411 family protein [Bacillus sp. (in: firmicutes)]|nr:DUF5411 family protein [Bacillus sp. (in: firmicutes)]
MEVSPKFLFFIILFSIFAFFLVDLGYASFMSDDVDSSLENAGRASMQKSVNRGHLRVHEEMSIDSAKFIENFKEQYKDNQSVGNAEEGTLFYTYQEAPPMVALETSVESDSFFEKVMKKGDEKMKYFRKEIFIYEQIKK